MAKIYYKGRDYSRAIGGSGGGGGSVDSTDVPTAGKVSEFDNNAHINSEDMSAQDVSDFIDALDASSGAYQWKLAGTATGNVNTVTVPNSAQEVIVIIEATSGVIYSDIALVSNLRAIWNVGGYYLASNDIGLCNLNVSNGNKTFQIRNCRYGAGDYKTTAILSVYYKSFEVPQEVADYVVEQGTSGIWTYRKWNSGIAECWGIKSESLTFAKVGSTVFYRAAMAGIALPTGLFKSGTYPVVETTASSSLWCSGSASDTATGTTYIYDVVAGTATATISFHLIGTWK